MSQNRTKWAVAAATAAAAALALTHPAGAGGKPAGVDVAETQERGPARATTYVYAVTAPTAAAAEALARQGYDLLENREGDKLFVAGDAAVGDRLKAEGFTAEVYETLRPSWENPGGRIGNRDWATAKIADTFYGGYHTSSGHLNHLQQVAAAKPDLTKLHTFGRTHTGKYDLKAICITKLTAGDCELTPDARKPRFFMMSQTHAREIAAGEMGYRLIDKLTQEYGRDADVTAILDSTEVWVVPVHNPDGLDIVAQGSRPSMQRKNRNPAGGNCTGDKVGVDLNRNNDTNWGGASTSKDPCSDIYLGRSPNSEVENQALQGLWGKLFKRQRGNGGNTPAPASATGYMLSIHTVAAMNLIPWQYANRPTPNDKALKAIGAQMQSYNGYRTGQAPQVLYAASGGHDDWIYDKMGVASATIELGGAGACGGTNFHPPYSCVDTYWKANSPVFTYLAKIAKAPYAASLGPNVRAAQADGARISAQIDARTYELARVGKHSRGADVAVAEYSFDPSFTTAHPMELRVDGVRATATATADTTGRSAGRHLVYVRARDAAGNYGPTTAAWVSL